MVSLRRIMAIARKEGIHIRRDWRSLALALAIPLLLLTLFGWALTLDVDNVPVLVWDQSATPASREFISSLSGSRYFSIAGYTDNYADIQFALERRSVFAAVIIPADFAQSMESAAGAEVQVLADGSDANTAGISLGYAGAVAQRYSLDQLAGGKLKPPVELASRAWYNPALRSQDFIIPGLIALVMAVIAALLTSLAVAREWERGTMEQLIATPVRGFEIITGKLIPYWLVGMADVLVAVLVGTIVFSVPLRGNILLLALASALFLIGVLSQGMLLSVVLRSQVLASQIAIVSTFLPTMFLSGFVFALNNMPLFHQVISYAVPARYFMLILRGVFLKGTGIAALALPLVLLVVYAVLMFTAANKRFKKELV
jgi:ABC-2 type transport system permease protein